MASANVLKGVTSSDVTGFDTERPRLTSIAIRILGSKADADDVLQEAWLRLSRSDDIDDLPAWLTTVVHAVVLGPSAQATYKVGGRDRGSGGVPRGRPRKPMRCSPKR